jgi:hypothetical protein
MWWTRGGRRRQRGNAMVRMAPMTKMESTGPLLMVGERVEQCADGAAASRTTAPGSQSSQVSQA